MNSKKEKFLVFGLSGSKEIASSISKILKVELGKIDLNVFADGEMVVHINESVRGKKIFLIQSTNKPANNRIMELLICIDALRRSSAQEINVIMPYYGYSRQDKKTHARQSITSSLIARLLEEAGATRVISFDLHSTQIQGFFKIPFDELKAYGILANEIVKIFKDKDFAIISPDNGGISRTRLLAELLSVPLVVVDKRRDIITREATIFSVLGNVKDKNCIIYDDMIDTGGTILKVYDALKKYGAKDIYVICTHGLFSKTDGREDVLEVFRKKGIKQVIGTNTVINEISKKHQESGFYCVVDLSEALAGIIKRMLNDESITNYFINKYNKKQL